MKAVLLVISLALCGCATTQPQPEPKVLVKIERIVTPIPSALLEIPDQVPNLPREVLRSDDAAVAKWLLDSEQRTLSLEAQLRRIRELYIQQLREVKSQNGKEGARAPSQSASAAKP